MEELDITTDQTLPFNYPTTTEETKSIIKVVGVGGGGSNAVANMYKEGIQKVSYLIINTDKAALNISPVPNKLVISEKGLGAGADPAKGEEYARQFESAIRNALDDGTEMAFITAGMGGGTGTGAGPIVAQVARDLGILTVGIVTIPFLFEGRKKIEQALCGVREMRKHVDALLVINNNRLIELYPDLTFFNAYKKADNTLTNAARSISDIINEIGYQNVDFADVARTLRGSGIALISTGEGEGENRLSNAINNAITSPLLQDNDINNAERLLFVLCFSQQNPATMEEFGQLNHFVENLNPNIDVVKTGAYQDDSLGDKLRIIILAAGFGIEEGINKIDDTSIPAKANGKPDTNTSITKLAPPPAPTISATGDETAANRTISMADTEPNVSIHYTLDGSTPTAASQEYTIPFQLKASADSAMTSYIVTAVAIRDGVASTSASRPVSLMRATGESAKAVETTEMPEPVQPQPMKQTLQPQQTPQTQQLHIEPQQTPVEPKDTVIVPPVQEPVASATTNPQPAEPKATAADSGIVPTQDPNLGFLEMQKYYGAEKAEDIRMDKIREHYYMLNDSDLSNEELVDMLEKMPAYNRSYEQLCQLKNMSQTKNGTNPAQSANNGQML